MPVSIVFGANGYIGRHLVYHLYNIGHKVIAVGNNIKSVDDSASYNQVNIVNYDEVSKLDFNVDYIFNFASKTGTADGFDSYQDYIDVNVLGQLNILKHMVESNSKAKIIFPSSRLVYKGQKDIMIKEEDEKEAKTVYAQTKSSCENYLEMYANFHGIKYTVFRICVPYGNYFSNDYSYGTIGFFLSKAKSKNNITLYGKGEPKRTFTHVTDICNIITEASVKKESDNKILNIGGSDNLSLSELALLIATKYKVNLDYINWPQKALALESGDTIFDDSKLKSLLNYQYQNNLSDWIKNL
jgi:UDP-glucose 4-epimerase